MVKSCIACDIANVWRECETRRKYISTVRSSFRKLEEEREKLANKKSARTKDISLSENRGFHPTDTLLGWIHRVESVENEVVQILAADKDALTPPDECYGGCCYKNEIAAYNRGAKVVDDLLPRVKALFEENLLEAEKFTRVAVDDLPVDHVIGMDHIFKEVWRCIGAEIPKIIRIYGMAGVGKTSLLKRVNNEFLNDPLGFNQIIWVDASRSSDFCSVQLAIFDKLQLPWSESDTPQTRASNINVALKKDRFVLIIDDPGRELKLTEVGIPIHGDNAYQKVVFATTDESVSLGLGGDQCPTRTLNVHRLGETDSMNLFEKFVGQNTLQSHSEVPALAQTVANICDGLPLMLVTLGLAMQNKKKPEDWKHTIKMLEKHTPGFENMDEKVYKSFYISYQALKIGITQQCFLYCALFPRNYFVKDEELLDYWLGENFLTEFQALDDIRNHGHSIINTLVRAHLLEKHEGDKTVKMHDAIRGSALWIAAGCGSRKDVYWVRSEELLSELPGNNLINWADVERISLVKCIVKKLNKFETECCKLSTLILKGSTLEEISRGFFQQMVSLKVLDLSNTNIDMFPADIATLTALQYLNLSHTFISELPAKFKKLSKLKVLDLSFMTQLRKIPPGVIRSLTDLQVLNMYQCGFMHEQAFNKGNVLSGSAQALSEELKVLRYLEDLRVSVTSDESLPCLVSSTKLHCMCSLFITKCAGSSSLQLPPIQNVKVFEIVECPDLEDLNLCWLKIDESTISDVSSSGIFFRNLGHVEIHRCWKLKNLTWLIHAPTLQTLKVGKCTTMEAVIGDIAERSGSSRVAGHTSQLFSRLTSIHLSEMPELKLIYNDALPFPLLEEITVLSCPKMSNLPLGIKSATKTLRLIRGHQKWWDNLQWYGDADGTIRSTFLKYLQPSEI